MSLTRRRGGPAPKPGTAETRLAATVSDSMAPAGDIDQQRSDRTRPEDRVAFDLWWRSCAEQAVEVLAASGQVFSADDIRGDLFGLEEPRHPSHWGALLSAASKAGTIEPAGFAISTSPSRRGGVLRLWRGTSRTGSTGRAS